MKESRPIVYYRPNMAALPPKLGRRIIAAIRNTPPFDFSKLDAECDRVERELERIGREYNESKSKVARK